MANTYTQIHIQIVFAVRGRENLITKNHREKLQQFITGIVHNRDQKLLAIYCMPNHTHILIGMNGTIALSDLVRDIKAGSSKFINDNRWITGKFSWQEGYGAFSYSRDQIKNVIHYILNQEAHHTKTTFREEYIGLLNEFEIPYEEKYLFEPL
jgi:putative transposase